MPVAVVDSETDAAQFRTNHVREPDPLFSNRLHLAYSVPIERDRRVRGKHQEPECQRRQKRSRFEQR